jgi:hypothetical protein
LVGFGQRTKTQNFFKLFLKNFFIESPKRLRPDPFFEYTESSSALDLEINGVLEMIGLSDMIDPVGADYYKMTWDLATKVGTSLKRDLEKDEKDTRTEYEYCLGMLVEVIQKRILDKDTALKALFDGGHNNDLFHVQNNSVMKLFKDG